MSVEGGSSSGGGNGDNVVDVEVETESAPASARSSKKNGKAEPAPPNKGDVSTEHSELVEWLTKLWTEEEEDLKPPGMKGKKYYKIFPERLELWTAQNRKGKAHKLSMIRPPTLYRKNQAEPSRGDLVHYANTVFRDSQQNCTALGKRQLYVLYAYQMGLADDAVSIFGIPLEPKGLPDGAGNGVGSGADESFDVDEETLGAPGVLKVMLTLVREMATQNRYLHKATLESYQDALDRQAAENQQLRDAIKGSFTQQLESYKAMQQLLNEDAQRRINQRYAEVGAKALEQTTDILLALLPGTINRIAGKELVPTKTSAASVVVANFIRSVSNEQAKKAFGFQGDDMPRLEPPDCIFTREQSDLLAAVAQCLVPADRLRVLGPGGEHQITGEQFVRAKAVFDEKQLTPLGDIFSQIMAEPPLPDR